MSCRLHIGAARSGGYEPETERRSKQDRPPPHRWAGAFDYAQMGMFRPLRCGMSVGRVRVTTQPPPPLGAPMRSRHLNLSISTATVYADLAWVCMVILLVFGWIFDDVALAIAGLAVGLVAVSLQSRCYAIKLDANLQLAYEAGKREGVNQGVRSLRP